MNISYILKAKAANTILLAVVLTALSNITIAQEKQQNDIESKLQSSLESILAEHPEAIGVMVHVELPNKKISWSGAAGISDRENQTKIDPKQPGLIASNTKTYVAAAILRLVENGQLKTSDSIANLISNQSSETLKKDGYDLDAIKVSHLLTHTSGIHDYVDNSYMDFVQESPSHRWTRAEQISRSVKIGQPLGDPEEVFKYADVNFLLLGEIIERQTGKPFFTAVRDLIDYKKIGLDQTWFATLEEKPANVLPMIHQYFSSMGYDSHHIDPSFDLYGAGGIAATTKDLACFSQSLFEGRIIQNKQVLNQIFTAAKTSDGANHHYHFGLSSSNILGYQAYGHGGFWGTVVQYIPELNVSIAVFVLERDQRIVRKYILETIVNVLKNN